MQLQTKSQDSAYCDDFNVQVTTLARTQKRHISARPTHQSTSIYAIPHQRTCATTVTFINTAFVSLRPCDKYKCPLASMTEHFLRQRYTEQSHRNNSLTSPEHEHASALTVSIDAYKDSYFADRTSARNGQFYKTRGRVSSLGEGYLPSKL